MLESVTHAYMTDKPQVSCSLPTAMHSASHSPSATGLPCTPALHDHMRHDAQQHAALWAFPEAGYMLPMPS